MNTWNNHRLKRRYTRRDIVGRVFIKPNHISATPIYSNGVNYAPQYSDEHFNHLLVLAMQQTQKLSEHKEILTDYTKSLIGAYSYFFDVFKLLTQGKNVKTKLGLWGQRLEYTDGLNLDKISSAPQTHKLLSLLNAKYTSSLKALCEVVAFSNRDHIHQPELTYHYEIDSMCEQYSDSKFDKVALVQLILAISKALDYIVFKLHDFLIDHQADSDPQYWTEKTINISASGAALRMRKQYKQFSEISIAIAIKGHIFRFNGKIVKLFNCHDGEENVAIDFEFPDAKSQNQLMTIIQLDELEECYPDIIERLTQDAESEHKNEPPQQINA